MPPSQTVACTLPSDSTPTPSSVVSIPSPPTPTGRILAACLSFVLVLVVVVLVGAVLRQRSGSEVELMHIDYEGFVEEVVVPDVVLKGRRGYKYAEVALVLSCNGDYGRGVVESFFRFESKEYAVPSARRSAVMNWGFGSSSSLNLERVELARRSWFQEWSIAGIDKPFSFWERFVDHEWVAVNFDLGFWASVGFDFSHSSFPEYTLRDEIESLYRLCEGLEG